jgi:hypothetical protein
MKRQSLDRWARLLERQLYLTSFAALLVSGGAALAENPYVGDTDINDIARQQAVDSAATASISGGQEDSLLDSNVQVPGSDRSVWGR